MKKISIEKDFSVDPVGRYHPNDGPFTGERFRNEHIIPYLKKDFYVTVVLDNELGYGSSFIDEAFGGIVRNSDFTEEWLTEHLILVATEDNEIYIEEAKMDIAEAFKAKGK